MFQWTTNYLHTTPSGASGVSITPSGVAWANSAYAQIHPGTDYPWVLAATVAAVPGTNSATMEYEFDVAVGPTGSPTVVATVRGRGPSQLYGHGRQPIPVPIDNIPSGQPVLGRMRKVGTSTAPWTFAIQYYKKPIAGNLETTTRPLRALPSAAASVSLNTSASGYVFGSWTQLTSGAPVDMALAALICNQPVAGQWFELEIGKGPSGSETVVTRVKGFNSAAEVFPGYIPLDNPVTGISAGNRVVARWRKSGTNTTAMDVAVQYYEVPL